MIFSSQKILAITRPSKLSFTNLGFITTQAIKNFTLICCYSYLFCKSTLLPLTEELVTLPSWAINKLNTPQYCLCAHKYAGPNAGPNENAVPCAHLTTSRYQQY